MTEPTDAELDTVLCNQWPAFSMQATLVRVWVRAAMRDALAKWGTPPAATGEPVAKLWLWKNFVGGKPEYWAFDNPFPCVSVGGDPLTLGEPCGWALFKPSVNGRPQHSEQEVVNTVYRLHTTPQPTQAQAGAVPLTDEQISLLRFATSSLFHLFERRNNKEIPHCQLMDELGQVVEHVIRRTVAAHGIKGGQHGADT